MGADQFVRTAQGAIIGAVIMITNDVIPHGLVQGERGYLDGLTLVGIKRRGVPQPTALVGATDHRRDGPSGARCSGGLARASHAADLALVASGTVSLELAHARTPMVIAYDMPPLSRAASRIERKMARSGVFGAGLPC